MIFVFYGVVLAIIMGVGLLVYLRLARRGRLVAAVAACLTMLVLAGLWPIPIHGGVTFVIVELYHELERSLEQREKAQQEAERRAFVADAAGRFEGVLPFLHERQVAGSWTAVTFLERQPAWLDASSGLVWSETLPLEGGTGLPSLEAAKAVCARYPPLGYWSLPTEAEHYLFWKAGGRELLKDSGGSAVSYIVDDDLGTEIPTYNLRQASTGAGGQNHGHADFTIRCVARAADAPGGGYAKRDIPIEEWNRYQLAKQVD